MNYFNYKEKLIKNLLEKNIIKNEFKEILEKNLDVPKNRKFGDLALNTSLISKKENKNFNELNEEIKKKIEKENFNFIKDINIIGPFINFKFNYEGEIKIFTKDLEGGIFFKNIKTENKKNRVLLEYPSPNTNKALHIGHVRNMLIGNTLSNILNRVGFEVIRTNLNNDRGIAICKSMLGYELFYKDKKPDDFGLEPDEFVSKCYETFCKNEKEDENLTKLAQETLVKWENGDKKTLELWKKIIEYVKEGYKKTYKIYKTEPFDKEYFESEIYKKGKEIILEAIKNNNEYIKREDDGAIYCDLSEIGLGKKYLLRKDGTSLYITQDIYLAKLKETDFNADKYVYIVAREQEHYFSALFKTLEILKIGNINKYKHFGYGFVFNEKGEKFSSRKGEVIGANWLFKITKDEVKKRFLERDENLSKNELEEMSKKIAYTTLLISFLRYNPLDDIKFNLENALRFEGETGLYILYTYARINSILEKSDFDMKKLSYKDLNYEILNDLEIDLIKEIARYENIILDVSENFRINNLINYLINFVKLFNLYYSKYKINDENLNIKKNRLLIIKYIKLLIEEISSLLKIDLLKKI